MKRGAKQTERENGGHEREEEIKIELVDIDPFFIQYVRRRVEKTIRRYRRLLERSKPVIE